MERQVAQLRQARGLIAEYGVPGNDTGTLLIHLDAMVDELEGLDNSEERTCATCGAVFVVPHGERTFLLQRGWTLPKRCVGCRRRRRDAEIERGTSHHTRIEHEQAPPR